MVNLIVSAYGVKKGLALVFHLVFHIPCRENYLGQHILRRMEGTKMKKILSVLLVCTVVTSMLAACRNPSGSGAKNSPTNPGMDTSKDGKRDPVLLRFSCWGGDARAEATLKVIKQFQDKYPNESTNSLTC